MKLHEKVVEKKKKNTNAWKKSENKSTRNEIGKIILSETKTRCAGNGEFIILIHIYVYEVRQ